MNSNKHRTLVTCLLLGASFLAAAPGYSTYPNPVVEASISVPLADLNLSKDAGVEVLYRRLQRAARQVCGPQNLRDAGSLAALKINKHCFATSLDRAVAEVGHRALQRLHDA